MCVLYFPFSGRGIVWRITNKDIDDIETSFWKQQHPIKCKEGETYVREKKIYLASIKDISIKQIWKDRQTIKFGEHVVQASDALS